MRGELEEDDQWGGGKKPKGTALDGGKVDVTEEELGECGLGEVCEVSFADLFL